MNSPSKGKTAGKGSTIATENKEPDAHAPECDAQPLQIIVLGMHRSGTSALTNALGKMGIYIGEEGELTAKSWENPHGFFERRDARRICDSLLHGAGADWWKVSAFDPGNIERDVLTQQRKEIRELTSLLNERGRLAWALKEPRLCFLLPVFRSALTNPFSILVYRHPIEVARSLRRRNGFSIQAGLALWEAYMTSALHHGRQIDHVLVSYHDLIRNPEKALSPLVESLKSKSGRLLDLDVEAAVGGIQRELHREQVEKGDMQRLSAAQSKLWVRLTKGNLSATAPKVSAVATAVLREFEVDQQVSNRLASRNKELAGKVEQSVLQARESQALVKKQESKEREIRHELTQANDKCKEFAGEISNLTSEYQALDKLKSNIESRLQSTQGALTAVQADLDAVRPERDSLAKKLKAEMQRHQNLGAEIANARSEYEKLSFEYEKLQSGRDNLAQLLENRERQLEELRAAHVSLERELSALLERVSLVDQIGKEVAGIRTSLDQQTKRQKREEIDRARKRAAKSRRELAAIGRQRMAQELEVEYSRLSGMRGLIPRLLRPLSVRRMRRYLTRARKIALSPIFDATWYLEQYPDVREAGVNPLVHYIADGGREGRAPSILFDPSWYKEHCGGTLTGDITPLEHYLATPVAERKSPHPLFDPHWYLENNGDVRATGNDPLEHFTVFGGTEGRSPHPDFSSAWYLRRYSDVAKAGVNPLVHYLATGAKEGREPSPRTSAPNDRRALPADSQPGVKRRSHEALEGKTKKPGRGAQKSAASQKALAHAAATHTEYTPNSRSLVADLNLATRRSVFGQKLSQMAETIYTRKLLAALSASEDDIGQVASRLSKHAERPLVSVIMPTFNRAEIVADAIGSILDQDYQNWELFVCDDASTDGTDKVVARIADARIHYLKLPKCGAAAARNAGLAHAKGDIIAYLDSDNYWHPNYLSRMTLALLERPGRSTAYSDFIDFEVTQDAEIRLRSYRRPSFNHEQLLEKNFVDLNSFVHRRELYDCFGGFDERLSRRQDYDLILKYTWLRDPLHVHNILMLYHRNHHLEQITETQKHDLSCVPIIEESINGYLSAGLPLTGERPVKKVTILSWDLCRNHFSKPFALAEALSPSYEVQLVSFRFFDEPIFPPLEGVEPSFETVYLPGGEFPTFFESIKRAIEEINGDILYVVKPRMPSLGLALLVNQLKGTPVILEINDLETVVSSPKEEDRHAETPMDQMDGANRDLVSPYSNLWSRLMDPVAKAVPTLVTHNRNIDAHFGGRCLYMRNLKDEAVHNPDIYDRDAVRAELGFGADDRVILFGGLLRKHKGIYELVELVNRLDDPRYKLLFVGSRPTPDQKQLLERFGDQVRVLPPQDRETMARINYAADLVILWLNPDVAASHYQMPYKATDALAMGPTIIANEISDLGPLAAQGYLRIAPFGNWDRVTDVIREVFDNPEQTAAIRQAARRLYLRQFSYAAARSNFELAARRALAGTGAPLPIATEFAKRFNVFYRSLTGSETDFVEIEESAPAAAPMIEVPGHGDMEEDASINMLDVQALEGLSFSDPDGIAIVMPSIRTAKALDTARLLIRRAGIGATVLVVEDTLRQGFIRTLNDTAARLDVKYVVYLAEDSFPGVDWLKLAYSKLEETGKGLLAFNCGKWRGRIAAFGMVRMDWAKKLYGGPILYPEYKSHRADNEITAIARATDEFVYYPEALLVENDPGKAFRKSEGDASNFHVADKKLFISRFNQGFGGLAPAEGLEKIRDEYLNQRKLRAHNG
jgi:glycosyltransferase involved in cell wall biosynthesis/predicted  nucleic acid-binding Zn-ribbon protein